MRAVRYSPPYGEDVVNPSRELLATVIGQPQESYWLAGSADAGLFLEGDGGAFMTFVFRKHLGFMVYFSSGPSELPLVLCEKQQSEEKVEFRLGGNLVRVPRSHFVSPSVALEAALAFRASGERLCTGSWIEFAPDEP